MTRRSAWRWATCYTALALYFVLAAAGNAAQNKAGWMLVDLLLGVAFAWFVGAFLSRALGEP